MSVSIADIKARIEALLGDIDGVETVLSETNREIAALPATEVLVRDGIRQSLDASRVRVTRNFDVFLYIEAITQLENDAVFINTMEDCFEWIDSIADFFEQRPRLERNDSGIVFDTGDIRDSGAIPVTYRGQGYAAFRLTIPVITLRGY